MQNKRSLALDIGNTRVKLGVFDGAELVHQEIWPQLSLPLLQKLAYNQNLEKIILSSVASVEEAVLEYLRSSFFTIELKTETALPFQNLYKTPQTLGKDRVAAAAGAFDRYPGQNCLIVDAGTCITLDVLDAEGRYWGGNISPGIAMRLKAMHHFTARLPLLVSDGFSPSAAIGEMADRIGDSTANAMKLGAGLGAMLEIEGFADCCRQRFGSLQVILTGGDADFFVRNTKTKIFAHPELVLTGLNKILQHNVQLAEGF